MQGVGDLEAGGKLDLRAAESRGGRETGAQQGPGVGGGQRQGPVRVPWGPGSGPAWPHPTVHLTVSFARPDSARPCASCFGCHQHVTWGHSEWLTWVDRRGTKEPSDEMIPRASCRGGGDAPVITSFPVPPGLHTSGC